MGKLVHYNKIFPFTEEDKETIKKVCELKDAFDENVFSYSEIPDKEDIYTKDDCNTDLAFVSYIGDLYSWDWMLWDRCGFKVKLSGYGFSDNASQAIRYAEEKMKDTNEEYCIVMVPFKPTNDMDEKFCYRNGPYLGVLEKPPYEDTLYGVHIPDNIYFMFHFNIFTKRIIKHD